MAEPDTQPDCIIVADSEVIIRNVIADYLRDCGYKVVDAANSEEVITILDSGSIRVGVVLCDVELQGTMNAFALRLWGRDHWPETQFILAGNVAAACKVAGELCEEGPHLTRPYHPQTVLDHIKRMLAAVRK
jgi:DNA-binding NtrC family response regulator